MLAGTGALKRFVPVVAARVGSRPRVTIDVAGLAVHVALKTVVASVLRPFEAAAAMHEESREVAAPIIDEIVQNVGLMADCFDAKRGTYREECDMPWADPQVPALVDGQHRLLLDGKCQSMTPGQLKRRVRDLRRQYLDGSNGRFWRWDVGVPGY